MPLDEPFCNLDAALRTRMRYELKRLQKDLGLTMCSSPTTRREAIILADRIAIMDQGELVQNDAPWTFAGGRPARLWLNSWIWRAWYGQRTAGCLKLSRDRRNLNAG